MKGKSDIKKYSRFIIIGETKQPMAWDRNSKQLCYADIYYSN